MLFDCIEEVTDKVEVEMPADEVVQLDNIEEVIDHIAGVAADEALLVAFVKTE